MTLVETDDNLDPDIFAHECAPDIFAHLIASEVHYQPRTGFMEEQTDICAEMRAIMVDRLVDLQMEHKLKGETLFKAVNLVDRFLERRQVARTELQLCGVTAMLIAAKFEETWALEISDLVISTDSAFKKEAIVTQEARMLSALDFKLCSPSPLQFIEYFHSKMNCSYEQLHLMQYVVELCLLEVETLKYMPSQLAAAAALLSSELMKQHTNWFEPLMTSQCGTTIKVCAKELRGLLEGAKTNRLQTICRKYSQPEFNCIAKHIGAKLGGCAYVSAECLRPMKRPRKMDLDGHMDV